MYLITAKGFHDGVERPVHFEPNTLEACAGAMEAMTCGNRREARAFLSGRAQTTRSYSATNWARDMFTARWVADSREEAVRDAQQRGVWPAPRPPRFRVLARLAGLGWEQA